MKKQLRFKIDSTIGQGKDLAFALRWKFIGKEVHDKYPITSQNAEGKLQYFIDDRILWIAGNE